LGASKLNAATWTCYYTESHTTASTPTPTFKSGMQFHIDGTYLSRIENFAWTPAPTKTWHDIASWSLTLLTRKWNPISTYDLTLKTAMWNNIALWSYQLITSSWHTIASWIINVQSRAWLNIASWSLNPITLGWHNIALWQTTFKTLSALIIKPYMLISKNPLIAIMIIICTSALIIILIVGNKGKRI